MIRLFENDIFNYLGLVAIGSGFLWCVLRLALRGVRHDIARASILASVIISIFAPLATVAVYPAPTAASQMVVADMAEYMMVDATQEVPADYTNILYIIYSVVMAGFFARIGWNIRGLRKFGRSRGSRMVLSDSVDRPFSFLNTIYINPTDANDAMIVSHARAHVRLRHSWDSLFMEVVRALFWANPFIYLLRRDLREVHEFQADEAVTLEGCDREVYKTLIFSRMLGTSPEIAGGLAYILTKKRIIMISQTHTRGWKRTLLLLPAVAALIATVTFTTKTAIAQEAPLAQKPTVVTPYNDISIKNHKILLNGKPYAGKIEDLDPDNIKLITIDNNQITISTKDTVNVTIRQYFKVKGTPSKHNLEGDPTIFVDGEEFMGNLSDISPATISSVNVDKKSNTITILTKPNSSATTVAAPIVLAETMATFQGQDGSSAFSDWISSRVKFPVGQNIEGQITASYVIDETGKLTNAKIVRGVDKDLDQKILDLINSAPADWTPAKSGGKPVSMMFILPLNFSK